MHSRIEELKAEVAKLEKRASILNGKSTFIDCVVDLIERYVLPSGEWLYAKAAE